MSTIIPGTLDAALTRLIADHGLQIVLQRLAFIGTQHGTALLAVGEALLELASLANGTGVAPTLALNEREQQLAQGLIKDSAGYTGKISAIKAVRERTGLGLKDSKDLVDAYMAQGGF